jgi:hypothetical protein
MIQAVLREQERGLVGEKFYKVCREELEKPKAMPGV